MGKRITLKKHKTATYHQPDRQDKSESDPISTSFDLVQFYWKITDIIKMLDVELMSRYVSPINPAVFPHLTVVLLGIGIFFMAWFFVYEVTSSKFARDLVKELVVSAVASAFMGFGVLFLLLWVGIYV